MKINKNMNKLLLLCCFLLSAGVFAQSETELPDVNLKTLEGETVNFADYADNGKITVFSFWATWCIPCKEELNNINEYYADWQEDYDMELVAVSIDDQRSTGRVQTYVNGTGWEYTVLLDVNEDLKRALNFQTVPFTMVVDAKGNVVFQHTGYVEGDEYELEDLLSKLSEE